MLNEDRDEVKNGGEDPFWSHQEGDIQVKLVDPPGQPAVYHLAEEWVIILSVEEEGDEEGCEPGDSGGPAEA